MSGGFKTGFYLKGNNKLYESMSDVMAGPNNLKLDKIGIIQFILFLYPLYERTFVENVKFAFLIEEGRKFRFRYNENRSGYSIRNEDALWNILYSGLKNITHDRQKKYGIGNSGGLDTRVVLYILKQLNRKVAAYTFGDFPSDAAFIADVVADRLSVTNKHISIEYDFLEQYWEIVVERRPMYSLLYSWYLSVARELPFFDIHITGFNGDNMLGSHLSKNLLFITNKFELYRYIYEHYKVVSEDLVKPILRDVKLLDLSYKDYLSNITKSENKRNENIFEEFNFMCRQLRFIKNSINFDYCGKYHWCSPFFTKDFMDFALNLTFQERYGRKLYYNTAGKHMKELEDIRFERHCFSLKDDVLMRYIKNIFWKVDTTLNTKLFFKGSHKNVRRWLKRSSSYLFVRKKFETKSEAFDSIFDTKYILENLEFLLDQNIYLVFNLLTVKLWIEKYIG